MKQLNNFITEKLRIDKSIKVNTPNRFDMLFDDMTYCSVDEAKKRKESPIAICIAAEDEIYTSEPIWMALYDKSKYEDHELRWANDYGPEIKLDNLDGYKNTYELIKQVKNLKDYPAFEYVSEYKTTNTKPGDWYIGSADELSHIMNFESEYNELLPKFNKENFGLMGKMYWTSCSEGLPEKAYAYKTTSVGRGLIHTHNINHANVLPLLKYQ